MIVVLRPLPPGLVRNGDAAEPLGLERSLGEPDGGGGVLGGVYGQDEGGRERAQRGEGCLGVGGSGGDTTLPEGEC